MTSQPLGCKCSFFHDSGNSSSSWLLREDGPRASSTKGRWRSNSVGADPVSRVPASVNELVPGVSHTSTLFSPRGRVHILHLDLWTCFLAKGQTKHNDALQDCTECTWPLMVFSSRDWAHVNLTQPF